MYSTVNEKFGSVPEKHGTYMFFQVNITSFDNTKSSRTQIKQHPQEGHKSANRGGSESFIKCAVHRHRKRIQKI
jgi:hypothetical protein